MQRSTLRRRLATTALSLVVGAGLAACAGDGANPRDDLSPPLYRPMTP